MSGSGYLERRYRRLLVLYPSRYRRRHEEEILAVLMEGASPGQRRPSLSEAASLVRSGFGMRLRPGLPRSAHTVRTAVRLMYLGALLELGVLAVVAATAGRLHSAILAHDHGYTAAQWHAEFHQHIVPLEIATPLAACVWVWLAWANGRGHGWARVLFLVFVGVTTASLLSGLAGGAFTYAPDDAVAGIVLCVVALAALALVFNGQSRPYYRRMSGRPLRSRHEHSGAFGPVGGSHVRGPELLAQVIFTSPLAAWSIWVGIAISTRTRDPRVASQLGILASLPLIAITTLVALGTIHASERFVLIAIAILLVLDVRGWRLVSSMLDRERLITGIKA